jgi:hypothetical protein
MVYDFLKRTWNLIDAHAKQDWDIGLKSLNRKSSRNDRIKHPIVRQS